MAGPGDKSFVVLRLKCERDKAPLKGLPGKSDGETVFLDSPSGFSGKMHWREKGFSVEQRNGDSSFHSCHWGLSFVLREPGRSVAY